MKTSSASSTSSASTSSANGITALPPTHEEIAARAREIWLSRGSPEGCDEAIWLQAEQELLALRRATTTPAKPARATSRGSRKTRSTDSNSIDDGALQDALDSVGNLPRSPSSINLT